MSEHNTEINVNVVNAEAARKMIEKIREWHREFLNRLEERECDESQPRT